MSKPVMIIGTGKYGRSPCCVCGDMISNNGLGFNAHMKMHVRRGEAVQYRVSANDQIHYESKKMATVAYSKSL
jgi:hypothetical protein